jgi:hypothetical protein
MMVSPSRLSSSPFLSVLVLLLLLVAAASLLDSSSRSQPTFRFLSCDAALLLVPTTNTNHNELPSSSPREQQKTYNYFAFGSNMLSSTMIDLRQLRPISSTAAILPGYRLRFNVPGFLPGIEPSWASVEPVVGPSSASLVHGVMHSLTADDFATICRTEGVPFAYILQKCQVLPYIGNGKDAGQCEWEKQLSSLATSSRTTTKRTSMNNNNNNNNNWGVSAYTLLAGPMASLFWKREEDIPPSRSYMNVLLRGAKEFALDDSYLSKLEQIPIGKTWIGDGLAERMLQHAATMERRRRRTFLN